jgi:hypothetical protein
MGIGAAEFWQLNVRTLRPYLLAENIKREERNYFLWLQGAYIYDAVGVVMHNAFSKKSAKKKEYIGEPVRITPLTEEEKAIKAEKERRKVIAMFDAMERDFKAKEKEK